MHVNVNVNVGNVNASRPCWSFPFVKFMRRDESICEMGLALAHPSESPVEHSFLRTTIASMSVRALKYMEMVYVACHHLSSDGGEYDDIKSHNGSWILQI